MEEMLSKLQQELEEAQEEIKNLEDRLDEIAESSYYGGYKYVKVEDELKELLAEIKERKKNG